MRHWPDKEEALLNEFLDQLGYSPESVWAYRSMLRHFQRFASKRKRPLAGADSPRVAERPARRSRSCPT